MTEAAARRRLEQHARTIETALRRAVPPRRSRLRQAIRYSLLAGGKRIRPLLVLASGGVAGGPPAAVVPVACAVEMVHTYSLVHDDLPAMDDDDLRRGRPTSHRVYGEGLAVLVGDALLTDAFGLLAGAPRLPAARRARLVRELADAAGEAGMVGGQALDLAAAGRSPSLGAVRTMHRMKTGALIRAAVRMGAIAGGAGAPTLGRLTRFGEALGLAFQIVDDLLDATDGGHDGRTDRRLQKGTYPAVLGMERARQEAFRVGRSALATLGPLGPRAEPLRVLVRRVTQQLGDEG